jgi:hypothetical protein
MTDLSPLSQSMLDGINTLPYLAPSDTLAKRYPRLIQAMKWVAILCDTEAKAGLRDYVFARDGVYDQDLIRWGGGEAVVHFGGPLEVITSAIRSRHVARRAYAT